MRLHALQYLRALAALAVVYHHATMQHPGYVEILPSFGAFGVDVFFVISGFIMVWIAKPGDTPARFIANRVRRVVPLYWFFTFVMAAILLLLPDVFRNNAFDLGALLKSLAFVPHANVGQPDELWPIVAPGWSLNYEMYFYLLFALSLFLPARLRVAGISVIIALVFALAVAGSGGVDVGVAELAPGRPGPDTLAAALLSFFSESIVFEFTFGMLLALAYRRGCSIPSSTGAWLMVLGTALLLLELPVAHVWRYGLPSLLVVMGCVYLRLPESRLGVLLGDASYALYLSHVFVLGVVRVVLPPLLEPVLGTGALAAWTFVVLALLASLVVGVAVHLLIDEWLLRRERLAPLKRLAARLLGRPVADSPGADARPLVGSSRS